MTIEHERLQQPGWKQWGPYLSERAWGTVREDYSPFGTAWEYLPHDHARSRAYRWNEDGIGGICDDQQQLCFALALWNEQDSILKERFFGLTGNEGNHGEDVKEYYYYLDSTPTHSWMQLLYKYPQRAFPYDDLVATNRQRGRNDPEYELCDTGVFADDRYFDVMVAYAKAGPDDILIRISAINRGPESAALHLLPTLWFRNTWSWQLPTADQPPRPRLRRVETQDTPQEQTIIADHPTLGQYLLHCDPLVAVQDNAPGQPAKADTLRLLFTENETNAQRLFGVSNPSAFVKDGVNDMVVHGQLEAVNPAGTGTKAAAHYALYLAPDTTATLRLRLRRVRQKAVSGTNGAEHPAAVPPFASFDTLFAARQREADTFYAALQPETLDADLRQVQRQALAGMLWSKQYYAYDVEEWLRGDPGQPPPPPERQHGRNHEWRHLHAANIISMPDTWEYPWFAAWDLACHCIALVLVDPEFAKEQLLLLGSAWYQHPNGQIPAYEWAFGDVNPPVQAWAAWRVYKIDQRHSGHSDLLFLERMFHKLMLNFSWWVNREDAAGNNVFQGGFLGLDNIGVFDRSAPLPTGGLIEQSDGTSWMGMFCLNMLTIALELAAHDRAYEDIATKFFEHFLYIAAAMNNIAGEGIALWDDQDEFFYDVLHLPDGTNVPLRIHSLVGLIPLFAVTTIEPALLDALPTFKNRLEWFLEHRPDLAQLVSRWQEPGMGQRRLLALLRGHRMKRVLRRMLDPGEFLSDYGVRALSRYHAAQPFDFVINGIRASIAYEPAESRSGLFGGNSNWRGPIWFPVNYLIIEALQQFHHYYGDDFLVECPTGSGQYMTLDAIANLLSQRLINIFARTDSGQRPVFGGNLTFQHDPHWRDYLLFHEYFHGDNGAGLGASHQTGWTGLVAKLIQQQGKNAERDAVLAAELAR